MSLEMTSTGSSASVVVDVIRFERPCRSDQCLFVSNLPSAVPHEELWRTLYTAFCQYGLVHKVTNSMLSHVND